MINWVAFSINQGEIRLLYLGQKLLHVKKMLKGYICQRRSIRAHESYPFGSLETFPR